MMQKLKFSDKVGLMVIEKSHSCSNLVHVLFEHSFVRQSESNYFISAVVSHFPDLMNDFMD